MLARILLALAALAPTASAQLTTPIQSMDAIQSLFAVDDEYALFAGDAGNGLGMELYCWRADTGVTLLADIHPGPESSAIRRFTNAWLGGQRVTLFAVDDAANGSELWRTDGTAAGTFLVSDFGYGPPTLGLGISDIAYHPQAGKAFVGITSGSDLWEGLWVTDGTAAGTVQVAPAFFPPNDLVPFGPDLFFRQGKAVHRYDPATSQVATVTGIPGGSFWELMRVGDELALRRSVTTAQATMELWRIDPVTLTGSLVRDINIGGGDEVKWIGRGEHAGELYFTAVNGAGVERVYRSDLKTSAIQNLGLAPGQYTRFSDPGAVGSGLLLSTPATFVGTSLVLPVHAFDTLGAGVPVDLGVESDAVGPKGFPAAHANGGVYFLGNAPGSPGGLFFTDGTVAGTTQVSPSFHVSSLQLNDLVVCDGRVLFVAPFGQSDQGLQALTPPGAYATDLGTYEGTPRLRATDPILGTTVRLSGEGAPAGTIGVLLWGPPPAAPVDLGTGVPLWIDTSTASVVPGLLNPTWTMSVPLPAGPLLAGLDINLQAWFLDPQTGALSGTNGVRLNLDF